jgi:small subunit ribosomal protein S5
MDDTTNIPQNDTASAPSSAPVADQAAPFERRGRDRKHMDRRPARRGPKKEARAKPEFDHKTVSIRRVTRVVAGGRRFSFSVTLVAGNRKGMVGVGQGKATDTPVAIEKAMRDARKNMIQVSHTKDMSIPHESKAKFGACRVVIMPAPGRGILAGSSVRTVLELAGLSSINAKILSGSKNRANIAKAAVEALKGISPKRHRPLRSSQ